jgi:PIN domain nuclease of toxin-antitoxin system
MPDDLEEQIARHGFDTLSVSIAHALYAAAIPQHHRDPFDRMLVAQAQLEGLTLATREERLARYGLSILLA